MTGPQKHTIQTPTPQKGTVDGSEIRRAPLGMYKTFFKLWEVDLISTGAFPPDFERTINSMTGWFFVGKILLSWVGGLVDLRNHLKNKIPQRKMYGPGDSV